MWNGEDPIKIKIKTIVWLCGGGEASQPVASILNLILHNFYLFEQNQTKPLCCYDTQYLQFKTRDDGIFGNFQISIWHLIQN